MAPDIHSIVERTTALVEPVLEDMGFELVDVEYLSRSGRWVLQLYIDTQDGVTIDDCVRVSREIGTLLDVHGVIEHEYVLEVSSPGINRPLKKLKDFRWACGRTVALETARPRDGRRRFTGILEKVEGDLLIMNVDGAEFSFPLDEMKKANLVVEF